MEKWIFFNKISYQYKEGGVQIIKVVVPDDLPPEEVEKRLNGYVWGYRKAQGREHYATSDPLILDVVEETKCLYNTVPSWIEKFNDKQYKFKEYCGKHRLALASFPTLSFDMGKDFIETKEGEEKR